MKLVLSDIFNVNFMILIRVDYVIVYILISGLDLHN